VDGVLARVWEPFVVGAATRIEHGAAGLHRPQRASIPWRSHVCRSGTLSFWDCTLTLSFPRQNG
jgi:hypothetical protein